MFTGIKTLKKHGVTLTDPENKADLLNNHFHSVFSQQIPMKSPTIRDWNSLTDTLLSAAEGAEDSVAKFTSLVRARD